jgi:hypothetical protein
VLLIARTSFARIVVRQPKASFYSRAAGRSNLKVCGERSLQFGERSPPREFKQLAGCPAPQVARQAKICLFPTT